MSALCAVPDFDVCENNLNVSLNEISEAFEIAKEVLENLTDKAEPEKKCECECTVHPVEWFTATIECTENDNSEIINELKKEVRETIEREIRRIYYAEKVGLI